MGASAPSPSGSPAPVSASTPAHTALNKNGLVLTLQVQRSGNNAQILARFRNESNFDRFTGVGLQAAVPKSQRLQLSGISKADLEAGEEGIQTLRIAAVSGVSLHLLLITLSHVTSSLTNSSNRPSHLNSASVSVSHPPKIQQLQSLIKWTGPSPKSTKTNSLFLRI